MEENGRKHNKITVNQRKSGEKAEITGKSKKQESSNFNGYSGWGLPKTRENTL